MNIRVFHKLHKPNKTTIQTNKTALTSITHMKKTLLILTASLLLSASWVMGQTASIAFNDNTAPAGTLTDTNGAANAASFASGTGNFNVDFELTTSGSTTGYSLWLETETGNAISITGSTYFTFLVATDTEAKPWAFTDTNSADPGFRSDQSTTLSGDVGATGTTTGALSGSKVLSVQFTLSGLAAGTYHLETTFLQGGTNTKPSEASVGGDAFFPQSIYTITVVPEPATWSLMALGGLGSLGLTVLRARRKS
jgi:hypothetical protein